MPLLHSSRIHIWKRFSQGRSLTVREDKYITKTRVFVNSSCFQTSKRKESKSKSESDDSAFEELGKFSHETFVGRQSRLGKRVKSANTSESISRYPKRVGYRFYREAEVPDDDHYLCKSCIHILLQIQNAYLPRPKIFNQLKSGATNAPDLNYV